MAGLFTFSLFVLIACMGYGLMRRPSAFQSSLDSGSTHAGKRYPFGKRTGDSIGSDETIAALISILLSSCGPSHISGRIWPIIVNSIQRMSWKRTLANFVFESEKRQTPCIVNINSSAAIILPSWTLSIGASLDNLRPGFIKIGPTQTMCSSDAADRLRLKTSATKRRPFLGKNSICREDCIATAVALAKPFQFSAAAIIKKFDSQAAASNFYKVVKFTHASNVCGNRENVK